MADRKDAHGPDVHFPAGSLFADVHTEGDAGVPYMPDGQILPNDGPSDETVGPAGAVGKLGTSGRDDQLRGDTVTGLKLDEDAPREDR